MFSSQITNSDAFLDMPSGSQLLYFHFGIQADDDGFLANPKSIMRAIGATEDEYKLLIAKKFVIVFDTGVCVIKHWRINNYIRKQIYKPTKYVEEKKLIYIRENGAYTMNPENAQTLPTGHFTIGSDKEFTNVDTTSTQRLPRIGKVRLGKVRLDNIFIPPTVDEVREYCNQRQNTVDPEVFVDFYTSKGWMIGKNKMKKWKSAVHTWEKSDKRKSGGYQKPKNVLHNAELDDRMKRISKS